MTAGYAAGSGLEEAGATLPVGPREMAAALPAVASSATFVTGCFDASNISPRRAVPVAVVPPVNAIGIHGPPVTLLQSAEAPCGIAQRQG